MAITYIVGIPRSGKTYYAMYQLYKFFVFKPKKTFLSKFIKPKPLHNYEFAYTNINQFDFSKSDKLQKLNLKDLTLKLTELYNMSVVQELDDNEVLKKAKELHLVNVLFVIDEVHNFLGRKADEVLIWWLTYHGHLFQDLILITQDLSLISKEYKKNAEFFYKAIPPSARLISSKFRYAQYRNALMPMNGKIRDFTIPKNQEVFNMYVSGAENKAKSVIHKYLFFGLFLFIILFLFSYYFFSSFNTNSDKSFDINNSVVSSHNIVNNIESNQTVNNQSSTNTNKKKLFKILCMNDICTYKNCDFPYLLLKNIIDDHKKAFAYKVNNFKSVLYYVLLPKSTFDFLSCEVKNDKNTTKNHSSKLPSLKF